MVRAGIARLVCAGFVCLIETTIRLSYAMNVIMGTIFIARGPHLVRFLRGDGLAQNVLKPKANAYASQKGRSEERKG